MLLIVSEKPSVGRAISSVVGANTEKKGYNEGSGYIVSWCVGHLVGLKYPNDYGNGWVTPHSVGRCHEVTEGTGASWADKWSFSQLPMIPDKWLFKVTDSTKAQYNVLKNLMNSDSVTEIICATDADREGESIFRYVYNMARCHKPVNRLWISSLEESAIRQALKNMKPMSAYDNLFSAGYATVFETIAVKNDEDKKAVYEALDNLWQKGSVLIGLSEVAKATGIPYNTLKSLDYETQQTLVYEYMMDSSQIERFYEVTNKDLAVIELDKVAKLFSVPVRELRKLPLNIQEHICGAYTMEYDSDSTNTELIDNIREMIANA